MAAAAAVRSFRPLLDRVLVQRVAAETKTASGILIPEKAQEKVKEATVVAVGPGAKDKDGKSIAVNVAVGDKVMVPEYGGTKLVFEDTDYLLFREQEILGIFNKSS